jgi:hypothetical protein
MDLAVDSIRLTINVNQILPAPEEPLLAKLPCYLSCIRIAEGWISNEFFIG